MNLSRPAPSALYSADALLCWFSLPTRLAAFKAAKAVVPPVRKAGSPPVFAPTRDHRRMVINGVVVS